MVHLKDPSVEELNTKLEEIKTRILQENESGSKDSSDSADGTAASS